MRISLNWLKKYVRINIDDAELVRRIGARLVEVEGVIDETHKYDKIYVVRVEKAEKIPDTHLTLCQINCGKEELVQVVCGAPNVREGMLAVWIAPGATVPASVHEDAPFVISKRKMLKKYESNGMLAGADELDFGDDHSGIVEIDPDMAKPGDSLAEIFALSDQILDIENKSLTHRPDCFGLIGFAREVHGILENEGEFTGEEILQESIDTTDPEWSLREAELKLDSSRDSIIEKSWAEALKNHDNLSVEIADEKICARYSAVSFKKHGELKKKYLTYIDTVLAKSGMRPIDPIVDATNYLMLLTGQPLHAFDYDKFVKVGDTNTAKIKVRLAKSGEKLELLDGKIVELNDADIVICSNDTPVALAGAMGGQNTEIDENTKNIILESATFSLYNLRKTQMSHGIFSEAITRFTKGQPAYQTLDVAKRFAEMVSQGFEPSEIVDEYPNKSSAQKINITPSEINSLLGTDYPTKKIIKTLESTGFTVAEKNGELEVASPAWRTDINIKEDIIEEIGRLLGFDNITPTLPRHQTASHNKMWDLKTKSRNILASLGANEVLTYSFVSEKLLEKAGQDPKNSYKIINSISPELQQVRQSIVPSLLDKAFVNQKIPYDEFALFEINKVYPKDLGLNAENVPNEKMSLGFVLTERKTIVPAAYYKAERFLLEYLNSLGITASLKPLKKATSETRPFEPKRSAEIYVGDTYLGVVGEFKLKVLREFKLAPFTAGFELDLDKVLENIAEKTVSNNFAKKDSLDETVETDKTYAEAYADIQKKYPSAKITPVSIYRPLGFEKRHITFHIEK